MTSFKAKLSLIIGVCFYLVVVVVLSRHIPGLRKEEFVERAILDDNPLSQRHALEESTLPMEKKAIHCSQL